MPASERLRERTIDRFWETIPPLWGSIRARIRATAAERFGITVEQFHVLRYVRSGPNSMAELAAAKNISRPAISQAVDVLVKKGLVARVQNAADRRVVDLTLTDEGNALLDAIFKETRGWMKERMKSLSAADLETVSQAMEALKRMTEE